MSMSRRDSRRTLTRAGQVCMAAKKNDSSACVDAIDIVYVKVGAVCGDLFERRFAAFRAGRIDTGIEEEEAGQELELIEQPLEQGLICGLD
ncbi:hypothetical protein K474DRAFT_915170 [Panus rudis PR-1116 ss-1]|nr:hypothetical protein K474DRAFT_915170 [Panus rudis PR-1116 ss-1]